MTVDIVIPTCDNPGYCWQTLRSINAFTGTSYRLVLVNNGKFSYTFEGSGSVFHEIIQGDPAWGYARSINAARNFTGAPYLVMLNDDIRIVDHNNGWLTKLVRALQEPEIGACGPISNFAMGHQSLYNSHVFNPNFQMFESPVLSGFCLVVKRSVLDEVGWLDEDFDDGGDDVDLSIRIRKAGYKLAICRDVFVYHEGSVTAKRRFGDYWNSNLYSIETRMKVFRKHGIRIYLDMMKTSEIVAYEEDVSRDLIRDHIKRLSKPNVSSGNGFKILDVGCGPNKILPEAVGVDVVENTLLTGRCRGQRSMANVLADMESGLPFQSDSQDCVVASHFIEHMLDPFLILSEILRVLKPSGTLLVTCPSDNRHDGLPVDPTHKHAYTPESLARILQFAGFRVLESKDLTPGYNLFCMASK